MRNTWAICPKVRDNLPKGELIPNVIVCRHLRTIKAGDRKTWRLRMGPRPIS